MGKLNEEHLASLFNGFGLTQNTSSEKNPSTTPSQTAPVMSVAQASPSTPTVSEESKPKSRKPKSDRESFMCRISKSNMSKIRILSAISGKSISDFVDGSITDYLKAHEEEYASVLARVH